VGFEFLVRGFLLPGRAELAYANWTFPTNNRGIVRNVPNNTIPVPVEYTPFIFIIHSHFVNNLFTFKTDFLLAIQFKMSIIIIVKGINNTDLRRKGNTHNEKHN